MKRSIKILGVLSIVLLTVIACSMFEMEPANGMGIIGLATAGAVAFVKTSNEYRSQKQDVWQRAQELIKGAKDAKRNLSDDEKKNYDALLEEMRNIDADIKRAEEHERRMAEMASTMINSANREKEEREISRFSFIKFIRGVKAGKLEGFELEMHQEAEKEARNSGISLNGFGIPSFVVPSRKTEKRAWSATGGSSGSEGGVMIQTDVQGFIDALVSKMVLSELGATYLTGLVGDLKIPKLTTSATATWEGENDENADAAQVVGSVSLSPKRLGAIATIGHQLLRQTSYNVESIVQNDIDRAIRIAVQVAAINGSGANDQPTGILNTDGIGSVAMGTHGGAPTYVSLVKLEEEVAVDNADEGTLGYLTNPKVKSKLKQTALDSGSGLYVWPQNENTLNGMRAFTTTSVPSNLSKGTTTGVCSAIVFGNWSNLLIANWGGLDVVVDPYTKADTSQTRLVINSFWDIGLRHAQSFAAIKDATTS